MIPEMINVSSSNVSQIGYDNANQVLYVRFLSNALYVYKEVPEWIFDGLKDASSVGSYLHRNVKNIYAYERIE
jgi:hypothetical protein